MAHELDMFELYKTVYRLVFLTPLCCGIAGGYYTIEQKVQKLRLVMLNTNLCSDIVGNEEDPAGQWAWLDDTLQKSQRNRETVKCLKVSPCIKVRD
jgi:hypothetical protein